MHHRSLAMRYSLFSMLHRWFSMHHSSISLLHRRFSARYGSFLSAAGCSLCTIEYLLMLVAKLQLNSDIPTNSDKIFIVFPVFYSYPSLHAVLTSTRFMTISAKIMTISTPLEGTSTKIMMTFVRIMMTSTKIMMAFVKIMTTSTKTIITSASLLSLSPAPEVLIFSAETLVV